MQISKNCTIELCFLDKIRYQTCRIQDIEFIRLIITHNDQDYNFTWLDSSENRNNIKNFFENKLNLIQNEEISWYELETGDLYISINKERIYLSYGSSCEFSMTLPLIY